MIRGRAGRARFTTNPRATVREWPDPYTPDDEEEEEPMTGLPQHVQSVQTPDDLVELCIAAGARARGLGDQSTMLYGPKGGAMVKVPRRWGNNSTKVQVLGHVAKLGLRFDPPKPRTPIDQSEDIPKTVIPDGGRPTLAYTRPADEAPNQEEEAPMSAPTQLRPNPATAIPTRKPPATQEDLEAALELIETLSARITALRIRVDKLEQAPRLVEKEPTVYDRARETRDRIMGLFAGLPSTVKMNAATVSGSLDITDETDRIHYRDQLARLAKLGQLTRHGGTGVGSNPLYSLPAPDAGE